MSEMYHKIQLLATSSTEPWIIGV